MILVNPTVISTLAKVPAFPNLSALSQIRFMKQDPSPFALSICSTSYTQLSQFFSPMAQNPPSLGDPTPPLSHPHSCSCHSQHQHSPSSVPHPISPESCQLFQDQAFVVVRRYLAVAPSSLSTNATGTASPVGMPMDVTRHVTSIKKEHHVSHHLLFSSRILSSLLSSWVSITFFNPFLLMIQLQLPYFTTF